MHRQRLLRLSAIALTIGALAGCGTTAPIDSAGSPSPASAPATATSAPRDKTVSASYCQRLANGDWVTNDSAYSTTPCVPDPSHASGDESADASRSIPRCFTCKLSDWKRAERLAAERNGQSSAASEEANNTNGATNLGSWSSGLRQSFVGECAANVGRALCECLANHLARQIPASQTESLSGDDPRVQADVKTCQS